ncbi:Integrin-linked kinase-associated serine/threonine phosphatase 2C [Hypsibius exemplaris]|uniref:Integrin-linked kinase-associated serine/threonine phosphatase 2C n=1 Tax=Hypsibius exemplaris TaxID=2072580 RepID=A0A1W0X4T6_HYPEX|nr:Integrin-linked kinase-associated serine/threonine phosphatase 2C [Hypsibius exemplaris]
MDLFDGLPIPKSQDLNRDIGGERATSSSLAVEKFAAHAEAGQDAPGRKRKADSLEETSEEPALGSDKSANSPKLVLKGFSAEMQGERAAMEDRFCLMDIITDSRVTKHRDISSAAFYGVFDGHGGRRAADFAADSFLNFFLSNFLSRGGATSTDLDSAVSTCMTATYKTLDANFLAKCIKQKPAWKDGTTATTLLILNGHTAFISNVGDSQAILCRYDAVTAEHRPIVLTVEHSAARYEERIRIQQQGGRVKDDRIEGILEVSRSIGDLPYKKGMGLISTPAVRKCSLTSDDKFIVVACDGLWKSLTPTEVIHFVLSHIKDATDEDIDAKFSSACSGLAREAVKRLTGDNVTVLLVRISSDRQ